MIRNEIFVIIQTVFFFCSSHIYTVSYKKKFPRHYTIIVSSRCCVIYNKPFTFSRIIVVGQLVDEIWDSKSVLRSCWGKKTLKLYYSHLSFPYHLSTLQSSQEQLTLVQIESDLSNPRTIKNKITKSFLPLRSKYFKKFSSEIYADAFVSKSRGWGGSTWA